MGNMKDIPVLPGGMKSDIVDTELGFTIHQLVKNLRLSKDGLWEVIKGYINYKTGYTDIHAAIEVTDDLSGDRFILFKDGTSIKRLDYDSGDGNGYVNETASTLSLPSGVTIGSTATLRFFQFRGVVRITGASEPLWYGYINRTLFPDAWEQIDLDCFETDTESWTGTDATPTKYDCDADGDTSGMWGAPEKQHALKVVQTANTGYAKKSFTVESGATIRLLAFVYRASGGTGNYQIKLGTAAGGAQYTTLEDDTEDEWVMLESDEITTTSTALHVSLVPSAGAANDTAYFDFIFIEQKASIALDGWYLCKAAVESPEIEYVDSIMAISTDYTDDDTNYRLIIGKSYGIYDSAQFSLLKALTDDSGITKKTEYENEIRFGDFDELGIYLRLPGTDLKTSWVLNRLTNIGLSLYVGEPGEGVYYNDKTSTYYIADDIDITSVREDAIYSRQNFYYDNANVNSLLFGSVYADTINANDNFINALTVGTRIKISNEIGTLDTVITTLPALTDDNKVTGFIVGHSIYPTLKAADTDGNLPICTVSIERKWIYEPSEGYSTIITEDSELSNEFYDYSGVPVGTTDISPNYSHHAVIDDIAYVISQESEEEDQTRYAPIDQYDVFPNISLQGTQVGDADRNLVVVNRDDRVVILKKNSISQFQAGGYSDIGIGDHGLYAIEGYLLKDTDLLFMDIDDVYVFSGSKPVPLLGDHKLKTYYQEHIATDSHMAWDKQNNELILFLDTVNLVYQFDRKAWYVREMDITPIKSFMNYDNELILFNATKFVTLNHSETTFSESISFYIKTQLISKVPQYLKKLKELQLLSVMSGEVTLTFTDPQLGNYSGDITPQTDEFEIDRLYPQYLFRTGELEIESKSASTSLSGQIRMALMRIEEWLP